MLKFSEATRLGATVSKQTRGSLMELDGSTCAFGSALVAIGAKTQDECQIGWMRIPQEWKWMEQMRVNCPECQIHDKWAPKSLVAHLNDLHHWTREKIADFIATIEPELRTVDVESSKAMSTELVNA